MVCFKSCFTAFKHRKRNQYLVPAVSSPSNSSRDQAGHGGTQLLLEIPTKKPVPEQPINHHVSPESKEKMEEAAPQSSCNVVKKVTFKTKVAETLLSLLPAEEVSIVGNIGQEIEQRRKSKANGAELNQEELHDPENGNDNEESEGGGDGRVTEESSESLFSISIGRNQAADPGEKEDEITSPVPKCNASSQIPNKSLGGGENASVLNPVEDTTTQLKSAAAGNTKRQQHYQEDKENVKVDVNIESCPSPEFSFNPLIEKHQERTSVNKGKEQDDVIAVDASLSNWLEVQQPKDSGEHHSSAGSLPSNSKEDKKVVFGALTIGVLKQVQANTAATSSAKSRRQRFGGTPANGTVGSYWRHSGRDVEL